METFSIMDMVGFADSIRNGAASSIAENFNENLDDFVSIDQIIAMIEKQSLGVDDDGNYVITEDIFDTLFENTRIQIYETGLAKLAAADKIECAWDEETNQMVFWTKPLNQ